MDRAGLERLLPEVLRRGITAGGPLDALFEAMLVLLAPVDDRLVRIDAWFDPWRAPEPFLPFLATWLDLGELAALRPPLPPGRLRALLAAGHELARWRGTAPGMLRALEIATGLEGFALDEAVADEAGRPRPFHVGVTAPAAALPWRHVVERLIERQKPAAVTASLAFAPAPAGEENHA